MTPPETHADQRMRRRQNALEEVNIAAGAARISGASEGDIARAAFGGWWVGDEVTQAVPAPAPPATRLTGGEWVQAHDGRLWHWTRRPGDARMACGVCIMGAPIVWHEPRGPVCLACSMEAIATLGMPAAPAPATRYPSESVETPP